MRAIRLMDKAVFVRELLPQDLKIEVEQLTRDEAMKVAHFLSAVVGKAHNRQMDSETRIKWQKDLRRNRSTSLDAPTWLWTSIVDLLAEHERAYLEHCRKICDGAFWMRANLPTGSYGVAMRAILGGLSGAVLLSRARLAPR